MSTDDHQVISYYRRQDGKYVLAAPLCYYSKRFHKCITCPTGMVSDGATGAEDVVTLGFWVHDMARESRRWDDGSDLTNWQASWLLHDILVCEGRWFRARSWWLATYVWGQWSEMWG